VPRIDEEVIVEFLEGDPDRPIITGRVYNADAMPPYTLPENQTQSGLKTRSSKEGTGETFNELRFEDKIDEEEIYFHAERDFNRVVENNDTLKVGFDKQLDGDQTIEIWNNRTTSLDEGNDELTLRKGNRTLTLDEGDETIQISQGKREILVDMGNHTLTVGQGDHAVEVSLGQSTTEAMTSIELKCGSSSIKLEPAKITIKSVQVEIQADATAKVDSPMTEVSGSGMLTLKGGLVKIN
jgi:type VI secretion system secreted protein VgrG